MPPRPTLLRNPDPIVRHTYQRHLMLCAFGAPFFAMIQYSPFVAVKTFNAAAWVPALAAILPASNLLAIFFSSAVNRSNKIVWVVRPMVVSSMMFMLLLAVDREKGWMFALIIIAAQGLRAPIVAAQSAIFRTNYPSAARSTALAIPLAVQMATVAVYSRIGGTMFDRSENWVTPFYMFAAGGALVAAWIFSSVRVRPGTAPEPEIVRLGALQTVKAGLFDQFRVLRDDRGFRSYELAYAFFGSGFVAIQAVMPLYLKHEFEPTHAQATLAINTIPMLATAVTFPFWGRLLDRFNPLAMRAVINGIWTATPLLLFLAPSMKGVFVAQLIQGLVFSGSILIWWLGVNYFARPEQVGTYMSVHQTLTGVRGIVTPFVGIFIANRTSYRTSMIFWFALMVIGTSVMIAEVMRERRGGKLKSFSEQEASMDEGAADKTVEPAEIG